MLTYAHEFESDSPPVAGGKFVVPNVQPDVDPRAERLVENPAGSSTDTAFNSMQVSKNLASRAIGLTRPRKPMTRKAVLDRRKSGEG